MRSFAVIAALAAGCASTAPATQTTVLPIPARGQASESPPAGWCAETAIQEALLYYGVRASQAEINQAGRPSHPDLYWGDIPRALSQLGIVRRPWTGDGDQSAFIGWVRTQIRSGNPVFAGVKLHPTEHPEWGLDHMVLIVGFRRDALLINTTWGRSEWRTHQQLAGRAGISLANTSGRFFAYAIEGVEKPN